MDRPHLRFFRIVNCKKKFAAASYSISFGAVNCLQHEHVDHGCHRRTSVKRSESKYFSSRRQLQYYFRFCSLPKTKVFNCASIPVTFCCPIASSSFPVFSFSWNWRLFDMSKKIWWLSSFAGLIYTADFTWIVASPILRQKQPKQQVWFQSSHGIRDVVPQGQQLWPQWLRFFGLNVDEVRELSLRISLCQ